MFWIERGENPLVNLEHATSIKLSKKDGYPEVQLIFSFSGGSDIVWELDNMDEAEGVLCLIKNTIGSKQISLRNSISL